MRLFEFKSLVFMLAFACLSACNHTPVTLTVFEAAGWGKSVDSIRPNPKLRYLRVTTGDRVALMVLGYVDTTPQGPIETWYSSEGEVLRLQNGRVVATTGLRVDWRDVRYTRLPAWTEVTERAPTFFDRLHDEMPGYRFGISETVSLIRVPVPHNAKLVGLPASALVWYEESVRGTPHGLPSARYGLRPQAGVPVVVYGEQCLSVDFCLAWQPWPVTP